jgi:copper chaperone CopZ
MKKYRLIVLISLCFGMLIAVSCGGHKQEKSTDQGEASLIEVKIEGMTCTGCEQTIQRNVGKLEGIKSVKATFTDGRAVIEYFPGTVDTLKIKNAITGSGYKVIKCSNIKSVEAAK